MLVKMNNTKITDVHRNKLTTFLVGLVWIVVFNATFNTISVISWRAVLLVDINGTIRSRKLKKDRQFNDKKKTKDKQ